MVRGLLGWSSHGWGSPRLGVIVVRGVSMVGHPSVGGLRSRSSSQLGVPMVRSVPHGQGPHSQESVWLGGPTVGGVPHGQGSPWLEFLTVGGC